MAAGETVSPHRYAASERWLHDLAFRSWDVMLLLAALESRSLGRRARALAIQRPVFITALPRAGTTLLLELCAATGEFATHRYRDMPFVLTPLLWDRFAGLFRRPEAPRERLHGDGMLIQVDSPEAFEEIIWKGFWPSRYQDRRILPWATPAFPDFEAFLREHIRKLLYLRGGPATGLRYISKNNLNIARIGYLRRVFPDAVIVVPFREPLQHAASLCHQHRRFLAIHRDSEFARRYMADIGHYDFGMNLRPVDFGGWCADADLAGAGELAFWLRYWQASYRYLLDQHRERVHFLAYDRLLDDPARDLGRLAGLLGLEDPARLTQAAGRVRRPRQHPVETAELAPALCRSVAALHGELQAAACNPGDGD